jgi:hypothetical protein
MKANFQEQTNSPAAGDCGLSRPFLIKGDTIDRPGEG